MIGYMYMNKSLTIAALLAIFAMPLSSATVGVTVGYYAEPRYEPYNPVYSAPSGITARSGVSAPSGYSVRSGYSVASGVSAPSGYSTRSGYSAPSGYSVKSGTSAPSGYSVRSGYSA